MNRMIFPAVLAAALLGNVLHSGHSLRAEEPDCKRCEVSVPILSKIPYVGRLFKNVAIVEGDECVERIGVDFEFQIGEANCLPAPVVNAQCTSGRCQSGQCQTITFTHPEVAARTCSGSACSGPACPAVNFTAASACAKGECSSAGGCPDAACSEAGCSGCPAGACNTLLNAGVCRAESSPQVDQAISLLQRYGMYCPQAGMPGFNNHAILAEVEMQSNMLQMYGEFLEEIDTLREKLNDEKKELTEALVATSVENAKLTAQLEASKETTKLAIENAVLKERLAVAQGQTPGNQQLAKKLAKKNAALQAKVEKLEKQVATFTKAKVEVAEKSNVEKK